MTDRKKALTAVLEKVEAGKILYVNDVAGFFEDAGHRNAYSTLAPLTIKSFNGSLDAAKALHEAVLPEWDLSCLDQASNLAGSPWGCEVAYYNGSNPGKNRRAYSRHNYADPARAWLIAVIKALISQEGEE